MQIFVTGNLTSANMFYDVTANKNCHKNPSCQNLNWHSQTKLTGAKILITSGRPHSSMKTCKIKSLKKGTRSLNFFTKNLNNNYKKLY